MCTYHNILCIFVLRCPWIIPCSIATIYSTFEWDLNHPIPHDSAALEFSRLSVKFFVYIRSVWFFICFCSVLSLHFWKFIFFFQFYWLPTVEHFLIKHFVLFFFLLSIENLLSLLTNSIVTFTSWISYWTFQYLVWNFKNYLYFCNISKVYSFLNIRI